MNFNFKEYRDKVYACWLGKNIGGTMGTPYECLRQINDIQGFITPKNQILPNDDLDLQLVWLAAMERLGPNGIDCRTLGEFWCSFIVGPWNEYGIGTNNMRRGLQAPLSGDYKNPWKHSNGSWIRTEIWACLAPGCPDVAARYAIEDGKVDHGCGEGTVAAAFVAAMQSAAFAVSDIRTIIELALSKIPEESRMAKSIVKLLACYDQKMTAIEARNTILELNMDIGDGWFEAPSNVAYAVLGLLWGEGDFKKSMITAINCGDDTDCTGATVGATLGILGGTKGIPADWQEHIGDGIVTVSLNTGCFAAPKTCTELTDRVVRLTASVLTAHGVPVTVSDGETEIPASVLTDMTVGDGLKNELRALKPYSFITEMPVCRMETVWDQTPDIAPNGSIGVSITFTNRHLVFGNVPHNLTLRWWLPEGFSVSGGHKTVVLPPVDGHEVPWTTERFTITAGDRVEPVNRIVVEVLVEGRPTPGYISMVLLG